MINKKVIVGLFAILVILMTVQSLGPAFASTDQEPSPGTPSDGNHDPIGTQEVYRVVVNVQGQGKVCWSGVLNGCTDGSMSLSDQALYVPVGSVLTFTATGSGPVWFVDGQFSQGPPTVTAYGQDHTITAMFPQD